MNKVILIGRLTREPDIHWSQGEEQTCIARYTLAVDRKYGREKKNADFISCIVFGKAAEFAEKWLTKGLKIAVVGRIQTGSYTNREGQKVYTTDVVIEEQEFMESKSASQNDTESNTQQSEDQNGFMKIPDGLDEELPFS